jgi:hypothetical protein
VIRRPRLAALAAVGLALCGSALTTSSASASGPSSVPMVGTFNLAPGSCDAKIYAIKGSYFRMIFPGGSVLNGPYFNNANSACSTKSYTLLRRGTQGGLITAAYQPDPSPAFNAKGNALANSIILPVSFTGITLSLATNATDKQSKHGVPQPSIFVHAGGVLSGQLQAVSVAWNHIYFNQGSPKPGGGHPGFTVPVSGTYNPRTRAFTLTWTSTIVKGQFNQFTGYWHLAGTFQPSGSAPVVPKGGPAPASTTTSRPKSTTTAPSRTTTTKPKTTTTKPAPTTTTTAPNPLLSDVKLINCAASASGGWSAGGTVNNSTGKDVTYQITVKYISPSGAKLGTSTASVPLTAGGSNLWSSSTAFGAPSGTTCSLANVSAS